MVVQTIRAQVNVVRSGNEAITANAMLTRTTRILFDVERLRVLNDAPALATSGAYVTHELSADAHGVVPIMSMVCLICRSMWFNCQMQSIMLARSI